MLTKAKGHTGSIPGPERSHVLQLLKPALPEPALCNKRGHHNEKPKHHSRVALPFRTRESLCAATKTQYSQKYSQKIKSLGDFPGGSSGQDPMLPVQGGQVQSLARELDPMCSN